MSEEMTAEACVWYLILRSSAKMNVCLSYQSHKFRLFEAALTGFLVFYLRMYVCIYVYRYGCVLVHPNMHPSNVVIVLSLWMWISPSTSLHHFMQQAPLRPNSPCS